MFDARNPAFTQGRWYKIFVESTGTELKITTSDIDGVTVIGRGVVFPIGFNIIDAVCDYENINSDGGIDLTPYIRSSQKQFNVWIAENFSRYHAVNLYVFGYFE